MVIIAACIVSATYTECLASVLADESTETNRLPAHHRQPLDRPPNLHQADKDKNKAVAALCTMSSDKN